MYRIRLYNTLPLIKFYYWYLLHEWQVLLKYINWKDCSKKTITEKNRSLIFNLLTQIILMKRQKKCSSKYNRHFFYLQLNVLLSVQNFYTNLQIFCAYCLNEFDVLVAWFSIFLQPLIGNFVSGAVSAWNDCQR